MNDLKSSFDCKVSALGKPLTSGIFGCHRLVVTSRWLRRLIRAVLDRGPNALSLRPACQGKPGGSSMGAAIAAPSTLLALALALASSSSSASLDTLGALILGFAVSRGIFYKPSWRQIHRSAWGLDS